MTEYALVGPGNTIKVFATNVDPTVKTKAGWAWLPVTTVDPGGPDPTQVREGPVITVQPGVSVTRTFTVRAKTAAELDVEKQSAVDGMDLVQFRIQFNHENRIRALESKAPITLAQFRAAVKALLP